MDKELRLLYYAPVGEGGLSDYAVEQMAALSEIGVDVTCLGSPHLQRRVESLGTIRFMKLPAPLVGKSLPSRAWSLLRNYTNNASALADAVRSLKINNVLVTAFAEYFAPLWAGNLTRLVRSRSTRFGVVVHDPIRDFQLGPKWWHNWSVSRAYSFIDTAFVHEPIELDTGSSESVVTKVIPHGPYRFPGGASTETKASVRKTLGLPGDAKVLLSFGHIRDGKNLDKLVDLLTTFPELHLLVAGREQSESQKPVSFYRNLAKSLGVDSRCHWFNEFIPENDVYRFFKAADYTAIVYSRDFRSASGVLNANVQFRLPVLSSSGPGPVCNLVQQYGLGRWVDPESGNLADAMSELLGEAIHCDWDGYERDNSWVRNAQLVAEAFLASRRNSSPR